MLEEVPTTEEMIALIGQPLFEVWIKLSALIESKYDMERFWNSGGKSGHMSINIAEAVKPYVLYTLKKMFLVF